MKLRVDNLIHASDHGPAVTFACEKLHAFIQSAFQDGTHKLEAGQSNLTITTIGRVSFTTLYSAVGSRTANKVHYFSPNEGLKFTLAENSNERAFATLRAVILGGKLYQWSAVSGAACDETAAWAKNNAWAMLGEAGLRAQAVEAGKIALKSSINSAEYNVRQAAEKLESHQTRDYPAALERQHENCKKNVASLELAIAEAEKQIAAAKVAETPGELRNAQGTAYSAPLSITNTYKRDEQDQYVYEYYVPAKGETWSHDLMAPNYQVTRDGEQLKLSSGLVCTVTFSQARAWLAGESEAPTTIYGACSKIEVRDKTSAPWVAVKCGCHVLDLRNIDGLGELVQPTHKPVMLSSSPRVDWSPETHEQIRNVILAYLAGNLAKLQENKRSTIVTCRENRNKIVHEREHHGETETVLALEMAKANEALETAKQALESYGKKFLGANLEQVMETAKRYLNALVRDKIA